MSARSSSNTAVPCETAGGVTVAVTKKLIEQGKLPADEPIVICITGNGLKTQDAVEHILEAVPSIEPTLVEFDKIVSGPKEAGIRKEAVAVS